MSSPWHIGIGSWILADGNYASFEVGQTRQFALEFQAEDLKHSDSQHKVAEFLGESNYRVNGIVSYIDQEILVLDFGVRAYFERDPQPDQFTSTLVGQAIQGTIYLGIDYFVYMELHCKKPGMIPLIYTWHVDEIHIETSSEVLRDDVLVVDESVTKWHSVHSIYEKIPRRTGANVLTCALLDVPPTSDGEPLALWDKSQIERDIRKMKTEDLQKLVEFYGLASRKLEQLQKTMKGAITEIHSNADFVNDLMNVFRELGLEETERNLSLSEESIQKSKWGIVNYLNWVETCKKRAIESIAKQRLL